MATPNSSGSDGSDQARRWRARAEDLREQLELRLTRIAELERERDQARAAVDGLFASRAFQYSVRARRVYQAARRRLARLHRRVRGRGDR